MTPGGSQAQATASKRGYGSKEESTAGWGGEIVSQPAVMGAGLTLVRDSTSSNTTVPEGQA